MWVSSTFLYRKLKWKKNDLKNAIKNVINESYDPDPDEIETLMTFKADLRMLIEKYKVNIQGLYNCLKKADKSVSKIPRFYKNPYSQKLDLLKHNFEQCDKVIDTLEKCKKEIEHVTGI